MPGGRARGTGTARDKFPRIQRRWTVLAAWLGNREGESGRGVPASDSGRGSSQGRVIGRWKVQVPTIAASASRPTLDAPSIEAYRFGEAGVAHPAPRELPKAPGKPYGPSQRVFKEFSVIFF